MGWDVLNPFAADRRDFRDYEGVFNYGCNREIYARNVINKCRSVATCINKVKTFEVFQKAGVPTVAFCTKHGDIPKEWDIVVVRDKVDGAKAEGLNFGYQAAGEEIPHGALYSEYFEHVKELRIVVFCGVVVGAYYKEDNNGDWEFIPEEISDRLKEDSVKAAKALDIDYVGFDVLVNKKGAYVFLEANSGPVLIEDVAQAIQAYVK